MAAEIKTTSSLTIVIDASTATADGLRSAIGVLLCLLDQKQPSQSVIRVQESLKSDEMKARTFLGVEQTRASIELEPPSKKPRDLD